MYYVYLLKSLLDGSSYVGYTNDDPKIRLDEHNSGQNRWTRKYRPYQLVYYESYYCKKDALHREKFLKSGVGNKLVKLVIENF
ncbi:MAG: putative endonuclease [Patescibacteria group bacterium]|nr:putative endonuclease [Patescibacteria group bacterium]MDQ5970266.1 putative endonuclease [Patescibacteria group bacterium]